MGSDRHGWTIDAAIVDSVTRANGLCDPRAMDWPVVAFIGAMAILLAIAIWLGLQRGRELETIRELTDHDDAGKDLATRVRRLQERLILVEQLVESCPVSCHCKRKILFVLGHGGSPICPPCLRSFSPTSICG